MQDWRHGILKIRKNKNFYNKFNVNFVIILITFFYLKKIEKLFYLIIKGIL